MELDGNEQIRTGRNQTGRDGDRLHLMGLDRIKLDWSKHQRGGVDWTGLDWTGLSRTAFRKTELDGTAPNQTGMSLPELDFTRLHYTALPWIELESTIQDSQFTAPRQTDLHRTAFHVSK